MSDSEKTCPKCGGTGKTNIIFSNGPATSCSITCTKCYGSGKVKK
jgi:DnaJ-class molecular chaperone